MTEKFDYAPQGVCAKQIEFELDNGKLHNVKFYGGCPGNLQAIPKLIEGQDADHIAKILRGNSCAGRGTSCADQLAVAIEAALQQKAS